MSKSKRIANPGCYPTGFIGLTRPLVDAGILKEGTKLTVNAISGYSGGGKGLMEIYEDDSNGHEPWGAYGFSLVRYLTEIPKDIRVKNISLAPMFSILFVVVVVKFWKWPSLTIFLWRSPPSRL